MKHGKDSIKLLRNAAGRAVATQRRHKNLKSAASLMVAPAAAWDWETGEMVVWRKPEGHRRRDRRASPTRCGVKSIG